MQLELERLNLEDKLRYRRMSDRDVHALESSAVSSKNERGGRLAGGLLTGNTSPTAADTSIDHPTKLDNGASVLSRSN
jgi:hypothetical protein